MKRDEILIRALRNVLIQLKVYEMKDLGCTEEEMLNLIDNLPLDIDIVSNPLDMKNIIEVMGDIGMDVCKKFDMEELSLFFGIEVINDWSPVPGITSDRKAFEIEVDVESDYVGHVVFHTMYEMISEGDYPDRIPRDILNKTLDFFGKKEEFETCKEIKDFMEKNKRLISDSMSQIELEQWKSRNVWKFKV